MDYNNEELLKKITQLAAELKSRKKYGLIWDEQFELEEIVEECKTKMPILTFEKEKTILLGNNNNLLIQGDNFHSLISLNYVLKDKIDVIYIDPPYNTGNGDFVYNDKFVNLEDSFRHSKWLNEISQRLKLSRELLSEKGVIFLSIDDNEQANLKLLCDQIFGPTNFVCQFIRQTRSGGGFGTSDVGINHDYVLCYAKKRNEFVFNKIAKEDEEIRRYFNLSDKNGIYHRREMRQSDNQGGSRNDRPFMFFPIFYRDSQIILPKKNEVEFLYNKLTHSFNDNELNNLIDKYEKIGLKSILPIRGDGSYGRWTSGYDTIADLINNENVEIFSGKFYKKERLSEDREGKVPTTLLLDQKFSNTQGSKELKDIFGKLTFSFPKPVQLIKYLVSLGGHKDSLILDFYAGSGTTGQSVLELNKEDGGNRTFILCTNNENGICENITYPRLKTVITGKRIDGSKYSDSIDANLYYLKTSFVIDELNTQQAKYNLVEKVDVLLCIFENIFNEVERNEYSSHFVNGNNHLFIYNDFYNVLKFNEFKSRVLNTSGKKTVYIYSDENNIDESLFNDINIIVKPIPSKIYEIYKEIVEDIKRK